MQSRYEGVGVGKKAEYLQNRLGSFYENFDRTVMIFYYGMIVFFALFIIINLIMLSVELRSARIHSKRTDSRGHKEKITKSFEEAAN